MITIRQITNTEKLLVISLAVHCNGIRDEGRAHITPRSIVVGNEETMLAPDCGIQLAYRKIV